MQKLDSYNPDTGDFAYPSQRAYLTSKESEYIQDWLADEVLPFRCNRHVAKSVRDSVAYSVLYSRFAVKFHPKLPHGLHSRCTILTKLLLTALAQEFEWEFRRIQ